MIDVVSSENIPHPWLDPDTALEQDESLQLAKKTETGQEFLKGILDGQTSSICDKIARKFG